MEENYSTNASEANAFSILCDASSLISLTDSCCLPILESFREKMKGGLFISPEVKDECIDYPLKRKRYQLSALRLQMALARNVFKLLSAKESANHEKLKEQFLFTANNIFYINGKPLRLVHGGEADMLALAYEFGIGNIMIDERTTRMLVEAPLLMREHLKREFGREIGLNKLYLSRFRSLTSNIHILRSSEVLILAYEKGGFDQFGKMKKTALEAALYAIKFAGCSLSFDEIKEALKGE
ncbi:MAG: hypothetical protein ABIH99_05555 [Candidatus Micrarchaeota archaeon]